MCNIKLEYYQSCYKRVHKVFKQCLYETSFWYSWVLKTGSSLEWMKETSYLCIFSMYSLNVINLLWQIIQVVQAKRVRKGVAFFMGSYFPQIQAYYIVTQALQLFTRCVILPRGSTYHPCPYVMTTGGRRQTRFTSSHGYRYSQWKQGKSAHTAHKAPKFIVISSLITVTILVEMLRCPVAGYNPLWSLPKASEDMQMWVLSPHNANCHIAQHANYTRF